MEYDLTAIGVDLGTVWRDEMSVRRFRVLFHGLPAGSRTKTLLRGKLRESGADATPIQDLPPEVWSETDWHLADVRDQLANLAWMYACVHRGENADAPAQPKPVPRPGIKPAKRRNPWLAAFNGT